MYQLVLGQYREQEGMFRNMLEGLLMESIEMRRIEFEGVPESIYHLSDFVIQNSINNSKNMHYRLMDSLNAEDFNNIRAVSPREEIVSPREGVRDTTPYRHISHAESLKFSFEGQKVINGGTGTNSSEEDFLCD